LGELNKMEVRKQQTVANLWSGAKGQKRLVEQRDRDKNDRDDVEDCEGVETSGQEPGDWLDVASKTLKTIGITREDELTLGQGSRQLEKH